MIKARKQTEDKVTASAVALKFERICNTLFDKTFLSKYKTFHIAIPFLAGTSTVFKPTKYDRYWYQSSDRKSAASPISTHAEMALLAQMKITLQHCRWLKNKNIKIDILVIRFNKHKDYGESRPCIICSERIIDSEFVNAVYYSNAHGQFECKTVRNLLDGAKYTSGYRRKFGLCC